MAKQKLSYIIPPEELKKMVEEQVAKARAEFVQESKEASEDEWIGYEKLSDYVFSEEFEHDIRNDIIKKERKNKKFRAKIVKQKKEFTPHQSRELMCVKMKSGDPYDLRYKLVLKTTGETIDDAQGYGYKSENGAFRAYAWRRAQYLASRREEEKERLDRNLKSLKDAINGVDTTQKSVDTARQSIDAAQESTDTAQESVDTIRKESSESVSDQN